MNHVIVADTFKRDTKHLYKKFPSLKSEIGDLISSLEENAIQGVLIRPNCYKIRLAIASKGRGKSGGGRVITCVFVEDEEVYLLTIFDKSDRENITDRELDELLRAAGLFP